MTAKLQVELQALVGTYFSDLTRAADKLKSFSDDARNAGATLSAAFTLPLALFGRAAVKTGAELDGLNRSMQAIEGSAEGASKRIKILNEIAKLPGLNFKDVVQGDVNLRSAGISADLAAKSMSAFGNALGILGKTGALGNVNAQIQQMASKTQGFGVDLKILKEWVPQVGVALQNTFGTANADLITKMGYTGAQVVEKLTNELAKLPKATGGLGNSLENLDDQWFKFTGRIGLAIEKSIGLSKIIDYLSEGLNNLATWFENLDPGVQKVILGFTSAVAVVGPWLLAFGALVPLFGAIGTGATVLGGLFSGPLVTGIVAAMGAFMLIKTNWWDVKTELEKTEFLTTLSENFNRTFSTIYHGMASFKSLMVGDWNALEDHMYKAGGRLYQLFSNISTRLWASIQKVLGKLTTGSLSKFFSMAGDDTMKQLAELNNKINSEFADTSFKGNNPDVNRRGTKTTSLVKPPSLLGGGNDETSKTDYWKEYIEDQRMAALGGKDMDTVMKGLTETIRILKATTSSISNQNATTKLIPTSWGEQIDNFTKKIGEGMAKVSDNIKNSPIIRPLTDLQEGMYDILTDGAANIAVGFGEWVGAFAVGVKSFKDLGNLMKGIFGDLMISTGKYMIVQSEAIKAFKESLAGLGVGGIVIGIGLVAAGSALKASASKGSGASYQQVPQNSVGNYQPIYTPYNTQAGTAGAKISVQITQGQTIQRGSDIYTTQSNYSYDKGR